MSAVSTPLAHSKKIYNPAAPFKYRLGCIYPGQVFFISGIQREDAKRISVNLAIDSDNIPFHFDMRLNEKLLVRNTKIAGTWGDEERYLNVPYPFVPGNYFEIVIRVEQSCFKVSLNDEALVEYKHRVPMEQVNDFEVFGDIHLTKIAIQG